MEDKKYSVGDKVTINDSLKEWCKGRIGTIEKALYNHIMGEWLYFVMLEDTNAVAGWIAESKLELKG